MVKIKKGDIVGRKSYGKDILFTVENIIYRKNEEPIAILKGLIIRIEADALLSDLCLIENKQIEGDMRTFEEKIASKINKSNSINTKSNKIILRKNFLKRENKEVKNGRILHLDGDKRYSDKSEKYYKKMGLDAIVRNVPENKQEYVIFDLLNKYNPDIAVITGHDRNDKKWNGI